MKVVVVAEFYPRAGDEVLGIWAHRQALAARAAGAEVEVVVLHRLVPPRAAASGGPRAAARALTTLARQPRIECRDGLRVHYARYVSPPRPFSYPRWGAWAAPALARALRMIRRDFAYDLVHAHNAVPAADAARRARPGVPLVVSVHGGDVLHTARHMRGGERAVRRALAAARLVLANSAGIRDAALTHGARRAEVVHLGADLVPAPAPAPDPPVLITLAHLVARKRHADVIAALPGLAQRLPGVRYEIVGDGPERDALQAAAAAAGVAERVSFLGQLDPPQALARLRAASAMVMPSVDEAFGVAYVEALASGVPAIGCAGEPGPEEIAAAGPGMSLVPPRDPAALATAIESAVDGPGGGAAARALALGTGGLFSWQRCGERTVRLYGEALR